MTPIAKMGEQIKAEFQAENLQETVVRLSAPDTVVIAQPHVHVVGSGTFKETVLWTVEHAQAGTSTLVEIAAEAGNIYRTALCKVIG